MKKYIFKCENGSSYVCKTPSCLICEYCTDIFYDYENGPYLTFCNFNLENNARKKCKQFKLQNGAITVKEYKRGKEK